MQAKQNPIPVRAFLMQSLNDFSKDLMWIAQKTMGRMTGRGRTRGGAGRGCQPSKVAYKKVMQKGLKRWFSR